MSNHPPKDEVCLSGDICPICYNEVPLHANDDDAPDDCWIRVHGCDHRFCKTCLEQHCRYATCEKMIPIHCPACPNEIPRNQVQDCLLPEGWTKYLRFEQLLKDPSLVECPSCNTLVVQQQQQKQQQVDLEQPQQQKQSNNNDNNTLVCHDCGCIFCSVHGTLHLGVTCEEYIATAKGRVLQEQEAQSQKCIKIETKPCSHCGVPVQKASGCDHIVCLNCNQDFCYQCGTHLGLSGDTIRYCSNCKQGYLDHRRILKHRLCLCLQLPCWIPVTILYTLAALVAVLVSGCCCGFFCCGKLVTKGGKMAPIEGIRAVLRTILLSVVDLFSQFGCERLELMLESMEEKQERERARDKMEGRV